jgi:hypothetical protein
MSRYETARWEMSNVTNVLILTRGDEKAMAALTNSARRWDDTAGWRGYFGSISQQPAAEYWGDDGKWPECRVWAGAFNYLNRPALLAELQELPWESRDSVQVLILGQDDDCWGLWMFVQGRLVEVDLPSVTRLPLKASAMVHDQPIEVEVGILLRRPPPTATSVPDDAYVYVAGGAWHFVIYADDFETAVAGILPVTGDTAVESAQAAAVAALRERFGVGYDIVWRGKRHKTPWWRGNVVTATA